MLCFRRAFAQSTTTQTTLVVIIVVVSDNCVDNLDNKFVSGHFNSSVSALCSTVYLGISVSSAA